MTNRKTEKKRVARKTKPLSKKKPLRKATSLSKKKRVVRKTKPLSKQKKVLGGQEKKEKKKHNSTRNKRTIRRHATCQKKIWYDTSYMGF